MSMQDSIADMFTRIRNAQARKKPVVYCYKTNFKVAILEVLEREGYIEKFDFEDVDGISQLRIFLKYHLGQAVISKIAKISKPSLPVYNSYDDMIPVCNGMGIRIVSTSRGLFSDRELREMYAKKQHKLGGEVIGEVL